MVDTLPAEIAGDASFDGAEYGWKLSSFPAALAAAGRLGFACLGGQLQFRFDASVFEMYWLSADASERSPNELWSDYVHRSCGEVSQGFTELIGKLDVQRIVQEWPALKAAVGNCIDPSHALVFVAYFVTEEEYVALARIGQPLDQNP
jgi:hypothetical protein